jgi:hypothetical protein
MNREKFQCCEAILFEVRVGGVCEQKVVDESSLVIDVLSLFI